MYNRIRGFALAAAISLAAAAQPAAAATFIFADETGTGANGRLVVSDYTAGSGPGTFVSWTFAYGSVVIDQVLATDLPVFDSDLAFTFAGEAGAGNIVTITGPGSIFRTGVTNGLGPTLLWSYTNTEPCPPGIPGAPTVICGGGDDGPQVSSNPPTTYSWRLESLAVPEPATWFLMIGGLGAVGAQLRIRRRRLA